MNELKLLLPYLRKYRGKILLGFLLVTLSNVCSTYAPRIVGLTIDLISSGTFTSDQVITNIIYLLLLTAGSGVFMFFTRKMIIVSSRLIEYDLRKDFLSSIESRPMTYFHETPTGTLMAYASNDIAAAREFMGPAVMWTVNALTTFVFALYFMLSLSVEITLVVLSPLPIIALTTYFISKKIHKAYKDVQEHFAEMTAGAQESFSGIRVVRAYVREAYERRKFGKMSSDYMKKNLKYARIQSVTMPVIMVLVGLSLIFILAYGGYMVINGQSTLGELTQFFIYVNLLIWPVAAIGWISNVIQRAAASASRLKNVISFQKESIENGKDMNGQGHIRFNEVSFRYDEKFQYALKEINLDIPGGSTLGIVGPIGSGKSTFINLIPGLYHPEKGSIMIDGTEIRDYSESSLRHSIALVQQETFLFSDTIANNISFGNSKAGIEEIKEFSRLARFHEEVEAFPEKYDTLLGERGITLSGGQKQRLSIARALIKQPRILILDDALSAVDTKTESEILDNLKKFMKDRTTIIISHRLSSVKHADRIIYMDGGRIIESGNHNELLNINGKYSELYSLQILEDELETM